MHKSEPKLYSPFAVCALLICTLTGCPPWLRDALTRELPTETPPTAADPGDPRQAVLPEAPTTCPAIATGEVELNGYKVRLWVGDKKPSEPQPLVLYWHGTGSYPGEAQDMLGDVFQQILASGGVVASMVDTTEQGEITSTGTWYTGDFDIADDVVACVSAGWPIDAQRIYAAGCSSGAVQAGALAYARSNYIAAAMLNSGGKVLQFELQDPARVPAAITAHGASDSDIVIVNFAEISVSYDEDLVSKGGFAVDCDHGGGHCGAPRELVSAQWEFLKAHPYGTETEPYANGLPTGFPSYCKIIE